MGLPEKYTQSFTLVFEGDIRKFKGNPLKTETPFGVPFVASMGNALEENDELRDLLDRRKPDPWN